MFPGLLKAAGNAGTVVFWLGADWAWPACAELLPCRKILVRCDLAEIWKAMLAELDISSTFDWTA